MAVRTYSGSARPIDSRFEGVAGYEVVEWDEADASIARGYRHIASGALLCGATVTVSAARQTVLAAAAAAAAADATAKQNFLDSIIDLATKVKNNTATAGEQRTLLVKLSRAAVGLLSDLP